MNIQDILLIISISLIIAIIVLLAYNNYIKSNSNPNVLTSIPSNVSKITLINSIIPDLQKQLDNIGDPTLLTTSTIKTVTIPLLNLITSMCLTSAKILDPNDSLNLQSILNSILTDIAVIDSSASIGIVAPKVQDIIGRISTVLYSLSTSNITLSSQNVSSLEQVDIKSIGSLMKAASQLEKTDIDALNALVASNYALEKTDYGSLSTTEANDIKQLTTTISNNLSKEQTDIANSIASISSNFTSEQADINALKALIAANLASEQADITALKASIVANLASEQNDIVKQQQIVQDLINNFRNNVTTKSLVLTTTDQSGRNINWNMTGDTNGRLCFKNNDNSFACIDPINSNLVIANQTTSQVAATQPPAIASSITSAVSNVAAAVSAGLATQPPTQPPAIASITSAVSNVAAAVSAGLATQPPTQPPAIASSITSALGSVSTALSAGLAATQPPTQPPTIAPSITSALSNVAAAVSAGLAATQPPTQQPTIASITSALGSVSTALSAASQATSAISLSNPLTIGNVTLTSQDLILLKQIITQGAALKNVKVGQVLGGATVSLQQTPVTLNLWNNLGNLDQIWSIITTGPQSISNSSILSESDLQLLIKSVTSGIQIQSMNSKSVLGGPLNSKQQSPVILNLYPNGGGADQTWIFTLFNRPVETSNSVVVGNTILSEANASLLKSLVTSGVQIINKNSGSALGLYQPSPLILNVWDNYGNPDQTWVFVQPPAIASITSAVSNVAAAVSAGLTTTQPPTIASITSALSNITGAVSASLTH